MSQINFNTNLANVGRMDRGENVGAGRGVQPNEGGKFQDVLKASIDEVNRLQADADQAINALATGRTDNVAEVMTAVQKADLAFKTLLQIRNKLLSAYDEVRQMRI